MNATAAYSFAEEVGLSVSDISKLPFVSDGANVLLWHGVAVMILRTLFPRATFVPGEVSYETKRDANWQANPWAGPLVGRNDRLTANI